MPEPLATICKPGKEQKTKLINHTYKMLVVDIDGTLVDSDGNISSEDREAVAKARSLGIRVSLSTGRGIKASLSVIDQLALDGYHIFYDGAMVSSLREGKEIFAQPLSQVVVADMIDFAHRHDVDLEFFSVTHYFAERETWSTEAHRDFFGVEATMVDFNKLREERIIKGGLVTTNPAEVAKANEFCRHFEGRLHFSFARTPAYPGVDFINIIAPDVSKGKALEVLVSHLGLSLTEVMAVGDGTNDISLLTSAGLGVAMGNAKDEVKAVASHVTLDVDHSGLAAAINKFLL